MAYQDQSSVFLYGSALTASQLNILESNRYETLLGVAGSPKIVPSALSPTMASAHKLLYAETFVGSQFSFAVTTPFLGTQVYSKYMFTITDLVLGGVETKPSSLNILFITFGVTSLDNGYITRATFGTTSYESVSTFRGHKDDQNSGDSFERFYGNLASMSIAEDGESFLPYAGTFYLENMRVLGSSSLEIGVLTYEVGGQKWYNEYSITSTTGVSSHNYDAIVFGTLANSSSPFGVINNLTFVLYGVE